MGIIKGFLKTSCKLLRMTFVDNNPLFDEFVKEEKKANEKREKQEEQRREREYRESVLEKLDEISRHL